MGTIIKGPQAHTIFRAGTIGYIDDNNIILAHEDTLTESDIENKIKTTYTACSGLLEATDGQLSTQKFSYTNWSWSNGTKDSTEQPCHNISEMKYTKYNNTVKYLGIHSSPSGNFDYEFQKHMQDEKQFGHMLSKSYLINHETMIGYNSYWIAAVIYYSPIVTFTKIQWQQIKSPVINVILPKINCNRNMP